MHPSDLHGESAYRYTLAKGYLAKAERAATEQRWDECLAHAREAVEQAGKSIVGYFLPAPKSREVLGPVRKLLDNPDVPYTIRDRIAASVEAFRKMGRATHLRATYGDAVNQTPPWELIQETEAAAGLDKARLAVTLAEAVRAEMGKEAGQAAR